MGNLPTVRIEKQGNGGPILFMFMTGIQGLCHFYCMKHVFVDNWNMIASVLTIHNMAYQGIMAGEWLDEVGIPPREHPILTAMGRQDDLLGIGLAYSDKLNTVSPTHALELHYPRFW